MISTDASEWVSGSHVKIDMRLSGDSILWTESKRNSNLKTPSSPGKESRFAGKVLGGRAAMESSIGYLAHEFGHFIETEERRFFRDNYGLLLRKVEIGGQICVEPLTAQATLREIRVMGIQAVLCTHFGCPYDVRKDLAVLVKWLPDWCPAYSHFGLSYSKQEVKKMTSEERDNLLYDRVAAEIEKEMLKHSVAGLYKEFRRRCEIHDSYVGMTVKEFFKS